MSYQLLMVKLPYTIEALRDEIAKLVAVLPEGSDVVIYTDTFVGIAMPHCGIPEVKAKKVREVLRNFSTFWIVGMSNQFFAHDGLVDPFRTWMDKQRRRDDVGKLRDPEYMAFPERWEPRPKSPE